MRLERKFVEKIWGRRDLGSGFDAVPKDRAPIGEVWFQEPAGPDRDLLIKYLFTSERLSIQVHPDDAAARALGFVRGKDEAWVVLTAEPGAVIGMGLHRSVSREELRASAMNRTLEDLVHWRSVRSGDIFYSPAGTIHAIGAGLTLVEVQQNLDVTYRLYDYGRPRELHLEQGIAAAHAQSCSASFEPFSLSHGRQIVANGPAFTLERWTGSPHGHVEANGEPVSIICLAGTGTIDGEELRPGNVWLVEDQTKLAISDDADLLVAYAGREVRQDLAT